MQWRVEQANRHRQTNHFTKDADKIATLQRQQFVESLLSRADAIRQYHLAHCRQSLITEEHVLGAT